MSELLPAQSEAIRPRAVGRGDDKPKVGEWYWITVNEDCDGQKTKKAVDLLFCVQKLASNHVTFVRSIRNGSESWVQIRYRDLAAQTRPEPNWKDCIQKEIEQRKLELQEAIKALSDAVAAQDLLPEQSQAPVDSLLPTRTRYSPEERKKALIKLKDKDFPRLHGAVEGITMEITARHRDLVLPFKIEGKRMKLAVEKVDERLFALELYAGLFQKCKQIRKGKEADRETDGGAKSKIPSIVHSGDLEAQTTAGSYEDC